MRRKTFHLLFIILIFMLSKGLLYAEIQKDIIYLLDTSGSMVGRPGSGGKNIFPKVKKTLMQMIDDIPFEVNTNIQIITFDMGVQSSESFMIIDQVDKQKVKEYIYNLDSKGDKTWITHGLQGAFEELEVMKNLNSEFEHWQYLYMFTDALNTGPGIPPISFDEIAERFNLESAEFNRDLYIVTLGVPENVVNELRNKLPATITVSDQKPGQTHIPINLTLDTDKKKYQENEPIIITAKSMAINLKLEKITANIINPVGVEFDCVLEKKIEQFDGTFQGADRSGKYTIFVPEKKVQSYILSSKDALEINVIPPKFKIYWKSMKRLKYNSSNVVEFYIKGKKLKNTRNIDITFGLEDSEKLILMKEGKKLEKLKLEINPDSDNRFDVSFYSIGKIDWVKGTKFMGTIDGEYNFQGKVYGKIPLWFWILIIIILILITLFVGLFVIIPLRFQRKFISYGNNQMLLKLKNFRKNLLSSSISIGKPGSNIQLSNCTEVAYIGISFIGYGNWFYKNKEKTIKSWNNIETSSITLAGIVLKLSIR